MIFFSHVSKSFWTGKQRKIILDKASFKIDLGESIGILAPNGTGKTTLIRMMAGLEKPDEGIIQRRCRVSFPLGHVDGVVMKQSGRENARYIAKLYSLDADYVEAFCRWMSGIEEYFDQPMTTYSQGMKSRFSFALMMALDFDVYLIDEGMPTSTDVDFNERAEGILADRLAKTTTVIVSHQAEVLEKYARKAAVMNNGRLTMFDTLSEAKAHYDYET